VMSKATGKNVLQNRMFFSLWHICAVFKYVYIYIYTYQKQMRTDWWLTSKI
jgi:hypothetical protein